MKDIDGSLLIIAEYTDPILVFLLAPKNGSKPLGFFPVMPYRQPPTRPHTFWSLPVVGEYYRPLRGGVAFHWLCNIFQSMFVSRGRINSRPIGKYRHHWMRRLSKGFFLPNPGRVILPICLIQFSCNFRVSFFRQAISVWASIADIQQLSQRDPKRVLSWELGLIVIRVSIYSSLVMGCNFRGSF